MSHWYSFSLRDVPRTMKKSEWKLINRYLRECRRRVENVGIEGFYYHISHSLGESHGG